MNLEQFDSLLADNEYDRNLVENVHPPDWENPEPQSRYHLVVIGAGTAGLVTAAGAAGLGARVALVERSLMGGDCLNVGCVPSKAVIRGSRVAAGVREAKDLGLDLPETARVNFTQMMERMRRLRAGISSHDSAPRFRELGVDVYLGQGAFVDDETIAVAGDHGPTRELKFRKAVIATGARAARPDIPGLNSVPFLTNENLFKLTDLPRRLGVLGAGPIGAEMAQAFARLGSQVFLLDRQNRLLPRDDPQAGEILAKRFRQEGIQLLLGTRDLQIESGDREQIRIRFQREERSAEIEVDQLLLAAGRTPNIEGLNLEAVGVEANDRGIRVNDYLQTTHPRIYAAGDVCSSLKFTHAADFQARIVIQNALFAIGPIGRRRASHLLIPWCTYTSPEVAQVGMAEMDAAQAGFKIDTYVQPLAQVDRAILDGQTEGYVKVYTRKGTGRILGATIVAEHAGELIGELTMAIKQRVGLSQIADTIHPYPTQAEAIRKLGDQFNRKRLSRWSRWLLSGLRRLNVGR